MDEIRIVNGKEYRLVKLLGKGKGGYSYLAETDGGFVVFKQIHHEPCDYYTFGNKIEAERRDYDRLLSAGIRIPEMYFIDEENECIIKEYIEGDTIFDIVKADGDAGIYLPQRAGLNIDYFPTNFVVRDGLLYYIDYECNAYMDEWSFENWGVKYWYETEAFLAYLNDH